MIADRLARALVRRYPRAWRERYERELLALFEDAPPTALRRRLHRPPPTRPLGL